LMGYDMHGAWDDFTGHNAPLFERAGEPEDQRMLNIHYAVKYWISQGASPSKITLGVPIYARTFTLVNSANHGLYDPASGPGLPGEFTNEPGMMGYHEFCKILQTEGSLWTRYWDDRYMAPYTVKGNQWIGYDDQESIAIKARYAIAMGLAGGMVWSLDTDDFRNRCGKGANPILTTFKNTLATGTALPIPPNIGDPPTVPPPTVNPSTAPPVTSPPGTEFKCSAAGLFRHPETCQKYYECVQNGASYLQYEKSCAPGTFFSNTDKHCVWASSVTDCAADGTPKDANHPEKYTEEDHGDKRCKEEGTFRNDKECRSFIICKENPYVGGHKYIAEEQFCPDGLVFDDKLKACNNRQFVEGCH
jgi:chitinase